MRKKRLRLRLRSLLIAVAILAFLLGIGVGLWRRHERFRKLAAHHQQNALEYQERSIEWANADGFINFGGSASNSENSWPGTGPTAATPLVSDESDEIKKSNQYDKLHEYHKFLEIKYLYASMYPWFSVDVDPTSPPVPQEERPTHLESGVYEFIEESGG